MSELRKLAGTLDELRESWGITAEDIASAKPRGIPFMAHRDFDEREFLSPDRREKEPITLLCPGTLYLLPHAQSQPVWEAECDTCGAHFGLRAHVPSGS